MKKKTYLAPAVQAIDLYMEDSVLLIISGGSNDENDEDVNNSEAAPRKRRSIWKDPS